MVYLMLFTLVSLCPSWSLGTDEWPDKCGLNTWREDESNYTNAVVPEDCTFGVLQWNYPKGYLLLTHSRSDENSFQLCMENTWATYLSSVYGIVDSRYIPLELPTKDKPTCTQSWGGTAAFQITASSEQFYMIGFSYRISLIE